ncbi:TPA: YSIRK-type signal peptide-containing protein [Streptococcus suis]|nr:YSIRK-type signal peptide-containing protein [Streptococcus suis]HEM5490584.1 YSIRK-type signal peptide-containing protein [Streptococcus suis]
MNLHFLQKKHHFGIRKFSIGVVSVALAISFSFAGGQVVAAQEVSQTPVSSLATSQTSPAVTEEATQVQSISGQTEVVEEVASSQSATTSPQETPSQDSGLVETEPVVQDSATNQELAVSQTVAPSQSEPVQNQTVGGEQSGQVAGELSPSIEPTESTSSATGDAGVNLSQVGQPVVASPDQVSQPVQPSETLVEEATPTDQLAEEVVQPVLRSARMARSVAAQELAKLPLDANGKLMTSVSGVTVHQYLVVNSDGSSQIVPATTQPITSQTSETVAQQVASLKDDFAVVTYESLYPHLSHQESFLEKTALETAIRKENGGNALSADQLQSLKQTAYMDMLDMRESFERVKVKIETTLTGIFEKSSQVNVEDIRRNKEKILAGLSYLDRQYSFEFGQHQAQDLILYHPQVFGGGGSPLGTLSILNTLTYRDLTLGQSATTYQTKLAPITNQADIFSFVEKGVGLFEPGKTGEQWFKETSKAHLAESQSPYGNSSLYQKLKSNVRLNNHFIPLLTLPTDLVYAISTSNTVNYGLTESYVRQGDQTGLATFKANLQSYADDQESFLKFWHRISQNRDILANHEPIIVVDSPQKLGTATQRVQELYSPKYGTGVLEGVEKFIRPLNLYANFLQADGQANGKTSINLFLKKSLSEAGQSVYTHELTHMFDKNVWLNGYDRRAGQLQEVFARGMFESMDVAKTPYQDPSFIINTAYRMGDNRTQNASPDRFQTSDDLKTYMQGILDVIYTLDYAEAQSILKKAPDERAVLLNKISLIPNPANNGGGKTTEIVNSIDTASAANLQTIADFVDQGLISGRYKFNGMETRGTARTNSYYTIPLFEPIYAALQNDTGSGGDISFKRNAYELLGEYGYEKGMVAYVSGQYANDQAALTAIMPEYGGDLATFKKAMFDRRIAKVTELKSTSVASDFAAIQSLMDEAIAKDLERLKSNAANKVPLSTRVSAVQDLKKSIFQAYLKDTDDFRTSIYQEQVARDLYVTNGDEKSQDGHGTLDNPYQSLSFALAQAKNGDRIKLVSNIMHRQDKPFLLDKAVTIDGQGHRLSFRGPDVELGADVTFADLTLNMLADGSKQPNIYANGYHLTLDQVSTTMSQAQSDLRPTLVAGSRSGQPAGSHGKITILNGNSDTRFNTIYAGNADSVSNIPVTISILSDFVSVDQGIKLSGVNGEVVMEPVLVTSKSSSLKSIDGNGSWDNTVTIDTARIYGLNLQNIQTLELVNQADVSLASQVSEISTGVELESGTQLTIANDPVTLGSLSGQGTVVIPVESSLNVIGDIEGNVQVLVRGFEQDLAKNIDKEYVRVEGMLSPTARITLEKGYNRFDLVKDEIVYRLVELKQPVQTHTVTLRFTQSGQLLKEKQVQVDNGQSITGVENDLPIATEGTYQLDPNFDRTVLTAITSSKTIEIPVVLVLPKASRYQPHVNGEARVLPTSSSEETKAEIVKQISLPADAGQFDVVVVTPIPQSSGDHSMTVRVIYDDRSEEELVVPLHILTIKNGEVVKHSLPEGVLPKADRYQPHVNGEARVLPASSSEETKAEIVKQISLPADAGRFDVVVVTPIPQSSGDYSMTVRVVYDDRSQEEFVVPLHILTIKNGEVVKHSLPEGVLEPLVTAKGKGVTHELPVGILPPLETANGGGVRHELPEGVLEPLVTAKGKGVTHELPVGILPPLETANGGALLHSLPTFSVDAIVQLLNAGHKISLGLLDGAIWSTGDGLDHSLPSLEIAKGSSVNHQLPEGTLPLVVTSKGASISHFLPEGIFPLLVTAKGTGLTHFIPSGPLPLTVTRSEAYTPAMPAASLLQQRQTNTETKPAVLPLVAVPQKQADQLSATPTSSDSATSTSNRLPETGERNNLSLLGFLLASLGFSFWIGRKKAE